MGKHACLNTENDINGSYEIQPLVSVVLATYRRDDTLEKALLSLANQTYTYIEIIVVDDNADATWNQKVDFIIDNVQSKGCRNIRCFKNERNCGSAKTRNIGIRKALGQYITFLDDDDVYLPDKIKNQVEHMVDKQSDFSITDLVLYSDNGRLIEKRNRKYIKKNNKIELLRYHLLYHMTGTDTMMFKKDYLLSIGGFPPIDVGDEFYLMQKAIEAGGTFSYLPVCDIKAYVHTKTGGLSSGESKINGENKLYEYKKRHFDILKPCDQRFINMRHHAVLAFAEFRRRNYLNFIRYAVKSFFSSPINCTRLFIQRM